MDMSIIAKSNVANFVECVLELVSNSLNANATSIAIRIHAEQRKIQIVDNGVGLPKNMLETIGEYDTQNVYSSWNMQNICNLRKQTLTNIRQLSNTLIITSRCHNSLRTYTKIFQVSHTPNIIEAQRRPSQGTTVSIYGFHSLSCDKKWNIPLMYFLIANIALVNTQVSFSIRDNQRGKVIMTISKPHSPTKILVPLYSTEILFNNLWYIRNTKKSDIKFEAYIGLAGTLSSATKLIFLNNKPVHCPMILKLISTFFINALYNVVGLRSRQTLKEETIFILLFVKCKKFIFTLEGGKKTLLLVNLQSLLQTIQSDILTLMNHLRPPSQNNVTYISQDRNLIYCRGDRLTDIELFNNALITGQKCVTQKLHSNRRNFVTANDNLPRMCLRNTYRSIWSKKEEFQRVFNKISYIRTNETRKDVTPKKLSKVVKKSFIKLKLSHIRRKILNINDRLVKNVSNLLKFNNYDITMDALKKEKLLHGVTNPVVRNTASSLDKLLTPIQENKNSVKETILLTLSEWSSWSYSAKEDLNLTKDVPIKKGLSNANYYKLQKRFDFLPQKLRNILQPCNTKLVRTNSFGGSGESVLAAKLKFGFRVPDVLCHQELNVRPCRTAKKFHEFRLNKELLNYVKILGQINHELIAGLIIRDHMKILLVMDQHAIHERIRYEKLLSKYKLQKRNQLFSVKLKDPIAIQLSKDICDLLLSHKTILTQFGITVSSINRNTLIVHSVPEYLKRNKYYHDEVKLKSNVQNLLTEISKGLPTANEPIRVAALPLTIHNAIAAEACRGAIKFGDPLTLKECKWLVNLLKQTKIPTRCAHGRPSIIPLLDLSELGTKHNSGVQRKLNFGALKAFRK